MATIDQPLQSYLNTTLHPRVIGELIHLIDPMETPMVAEFGLDSARSKFQIGMNGKKIEILEDVYPTLSSSFTQGAVIATNSTTLTVDDGSLLNVGMVILAGDEYMHVSSISGDDVTFVRDFGGTNSTHAATASFEIVGYARLEGADATYGPIEEITAPYNYTSIFQDAVKVTGTELAIDHYGLANMFDYQIAKKSKELLRLLNRSFYYGVRAAGSSTTGRSFGGIETFVTDNSESITTTLTKAALDSVAKQIFDDGGYVDMLVLPSAGWKTLRDLMDTSSFVRIDQENTEFGMKNIARANLFAFDNIRIVVDRWCPAQKCFLLNSQKIGFYSLRPLSMYDIYRSGDYVAGELIGEYSLLVANDKSHGKVITTSTNL